MAAALALAGAALLAGAPAAQAARPQVLFINSYHHGYAWSDGVTNGLQDVLQHDVGDLELSMEYLDTKRYPAERMFAVKEELFLQKYGNVRFDVVICSDNSALDFVLPRRQKLFHGAPIVFCGINNFHDEMLLGQGNITGICEEPDFRGCLSMALRLHPGVRHVAILTDSEVTSVMTRRKLLDIEKDFAGRADYIWLDNWALDELPGQLRGLPADSMVFLAATARDRKGTYFSVGEVRSLIAANTTCPIYTAWETGVGKGALGGLAISGRSQGETAAKLAARILRGESARDIPIIRQCASVPTFDFPSMRRFGLSASDLPEGSVILNQPRSLYREFQAYFWIVGVFVLLQTLAIAALVFTVRRRRRAEAAHRQSEERFRALFDNSRDGIFWADAGGKITHCNKAAEALLEMPSEKIVGMHQSQLHPPELSPEADRRFKAHVAGLGEPAEEIDVLTASGRRVPVIITASQALVGGQQIVQGIFHDISVLKRAEAQLVAARNRLVNAQENERRRLAGELHDSIGQELVALKLAAQSAAMDASDAALSTKMGVLVERCAQTIREVRAICQGLYPPALESMGLAAALRQLGNSCEPGMDFDMEWDDSLDAVRLGPEREIALFRIAQEALSNAVRHSGGGVVAFAVDRLNGSVRLSVTDDGAGFDPAAVRAGLGLRSMRERAEAAGGRLSVQSGPQGTAVEAIVPIVSA